jgi:hypothetical protein
MRRSRPGGLRVTAGLVGLLAIAPPAQAVEYRLQVASILQTAFVSFLTLGELKDGAAGPGLDRLETSLDRGAMPRGAILFDRRVQPARQSLALAYGGARVVPEMKPGGDGSTAWDEITWDGKPGERSVWLVLPTMRSMQELHDVALKGNGPLRHFQPFGFLLGGARTPALTLPLSLLWFQEQRGTAWHKYISRGLELEHGIGAVVGVNSDALFPDQVCLIVSHAEQPTTYKAVLVWGQRNVDREAPGFQNPLFQE